MESARSIPSVRQAASCDIAVSDLDDLLDEAGIVMDEIPRDALFLAGKAFRRYRTAGGARSGVLPDFFIGAHAAVLGLPLLTRDARRYRSYFPSVVLTTPEAR